jgi:hypothetical protein
MDKGKVKDKPLLEVLKEGNRGKVVRTYHIYNLPASLHNEVWKLKSELGFEVELHEVYKLVLSIGLRHAREHWNEFEKLREEKKKLRELKLTAKERGKRKEV